MGSFFYSAPRPQTLRALPPASEEREHASALIATAALPHHTPERFGSCTVDGAMEHQAPVDGLSFCVGCNKRTEHIDDSSGMVCTECGDVLEQIMFGEQTDPTGYSGLNVMNTRPGAHNNEREVAKRKLTVKDLLGRIAMDFGVHRVDEMLHLVHEMTRLRGTIFGGPSMEAVCAACAYVVMKKEGKLVHLGQAGAPLGQSAHQVRLSGVHGWLYGMLQVGTQLTKLRKALLQLGLEHWLVVEGAQNLPENKALQLCTDKAAIEHAKLIRKCAGRSVCGNRLIERVAGASTSYWPV